MSNVNFIHSSTVFALYDDWEGSEYPEIVNSKCIHLQFIGPVKDKYIPKLVKFSNKFERVIISISSIFTNYAGWSFEFLTQFDRLNDIRILDYKFTDFEQLDYIPTGLDSIKIKDSKSKKLSLSFLAKFKKLKKLDIEGHKKDIEVISELKNLEKIAIRSITLADLKPFVPLKKLERLEIRLGGTRDLGLLPELKKLKYLELWSIYKLVDINIIAESYSLESIFLDSLKNIEIVSSFRALKKMKAIQLNNMKGLKQLQWAADAPNLELFGFSMAPSHLDVVDFSPFVGHIKLKAATIGTSSNKKNFKIKKILNLPTIRDYQKNNS